MYLFVICCFILHTYYVSELLARSASSRRWPGQYPAVPLTANQMTQDEAENRKEQESVGTIEGAAYVCPKALEPRTSKLIRLHR